MPLRREMRLQRVARRAADDEQMIDVAGVALAAATSTGAPASARAIARRRARGGASVQRAEQRQPRAQDRRLHLVEPRVDARLLRDDSDRSVRRCAAA